MARRKSVLYQFKVTLRDVDPPIWRRIQVWGDATLAQLHRAMQVVMGWEDYHLHEFRIEHKRYGVPNHEDHRKIVDVKRIRIQSVIHTVGTECVYVYDFGDCWQHDLLLEAIVLPAPDTSYPLCIAGERSGPPEDVGGSGGYEKYLAALTDPFHKEYENMLAWRGPFDPEAFSLAAINQQLQKKFHSARRRVVPPTPAQRIPTNGGGADKSSLLRTLSLKSAALRNDRVRIQRDEMVSLELNDREREMIRWHTFADDTLTDRLRVVPKTGEHAVYRFTIDDLDELAGFVASEANHAKNKKVQTEWQQLLDRIEGALEGYMDEDN